jgi:hypothetical protein
MIKLNITFVLFCIVFQIQSHATVFEGYVKNFMGIGVKNKTVYFCDGRHTGQLLQNEQLLAVSNSGSVIHKVLTNEEGLFRIEMDSFRFVNTFLVFSNDICFSYSINNFKVLADAVVYVNTERFSTFEGQFGSDNDNKTFRHKKHYIVNAQGIEIETGMISRIVSYNGVVTIKEGVWKQFYDSGKLKMSGSYKNEKLNGPFILYNEKGDVLLTIQYEEDRIVSYSQSINGRIKNFRVVEKFPHHTLLE